MPERTGHGAVRMDGDYYATTPALARRIVQQVKQDLIPNPRLILEPGCGAGSFLLGCREEYPEADLRGIEVNPNLADWSRALRFAVETGDFMDNAHGGKIDLIVGNPPFALAEDFIQHSRELLTPDGYLVFLLRLNYLAGQERYETLWTTWEPAMVYPLAARPGFTPDGQTDATDYMVCAWAKEPQPTRLSFALDVRGIQVKWNGTPAKKDKQKRIVREAVLDPEFPEPGRMMWLAAEAEARRKKATVEV